MCFSDAAYLSVDAVNEAIRLAKLLNDADLPRLRSHVVAPTTTATTAAAAALAPATLAPHTGQKRRSCSVDVDARHGNVSMQLHVIATYRPEGLGDGRLLSMMSAQDFSISYKGK